MLLATKIPESSTFTSRLIYSKLNNMGRVRKDSERSARNFSATQSHLAVASFEVQNNECQE